jgi:hypothetical protein
MRVLLTTIAILLAASTALQAQIAAPRLNPITPSIISASNPAVFVWGGPTRAGLGYFDMNLTDRPVGGPDTEIASGNGTQLQFDWVGESFAFHAETIAITLDLIPAIGGGTFEVDKDAIGAAYQAGGLFSIGAGLESGSISAQGFLEESSLPLLGGTLRLGEVFYLGAVLGTETVSDAAGDVDRSVQRLGIGVHSREGDFGYHVEVYQETSDSATNATTGTSADQEETSGWGVEVVLMGGLLLGIESATTDDTSPAGVAGDVEDQTLVSVGWAGSEGLSIVLSVWNQEETATNGDINEFAFTFLGLSWIF